MKQLIWIFAVLPSAALGLQNDVHLVNIRSPSPACESKISMTTTAAGATVVKFNEVKVAQSDVRPFVRCRLLGDITIPNGYTILPNTILEAVIHGHFDKVGDQAAGKLLITFLDTRSSDFQALRQSNAPASELGEEQALQLHTALPVINACDGDRTLTLSIHLEAMINYRLDQISSVAASLDSITIPKITLDPANCLPTN